MDERNKQRVNILKRSFIEKQFSLFDISQTEAIKVSKISSMTRVCTVRSLSHIGKAISRNIKWKDYKLVSLIAKLYVRMLNDEYIVFLIK